MSSESETLIAGSSSNPENNFQNYGAVNVEEEDEDSSSVGSVGVFMSCTSYCAFSLGYRVAIGAASHTNPSV